MNIVKESVIFTNRYIRENLLKYIFMSGVIFIVSGLIAFLAMMSLPKDHLVEIYSIINETFVGKDVVNSDGTLSFLGIFFNNLRAGVIISLVGLIPFLFIPVLCLIINSIIISVVLVIASVFADESVIMMFIKYILPHGIFELPALIIEGAIGIKICTFLCRKIFGRAKNESLMFHIKVCLEIFAVYIIPLLLIAAFIEAVVLSALYL